MLTEPFKTYQRCKELMADYYHRLSQAHSDGTKVAWGVALTPSEILRAMDIEPVLGEPYSAACAAGGFAPELVATTEQYGFGREFCSYSRNFIGSYLAGKGPAGRMPEPTLMVGNKMGCNDHMVWFETLARQMGKPFYGLDIPILYEEVRPEHVEYVTEQLRGFVRFVEEVTGQHAEEERVVAGVVNAHRSRVLWARILEYCKRSPSPLNFKSQLSFMAPAISLRGAEESTEVYAMLLDEVADRVRRGVASVAEEKVRLLWDGIPPWHYMRLFSYLEERGANPVASPYVLLFGDPENWASPLPGGQLLAWREPTTQDEALREKAKDYLRHQTTQSLPAKIRICEQAVREYGISGAIFHGNRGCKSSCLNNLDAAEYLRKECGIPVLTFHGSNADPRDFDREGVMAQVESFVDELLAG